MKKSKVFLKVFAVVIALVLVVAPVLSLAPVPFSHSSCSFPFKEVSEAEFMRSFRPRLSVANAAGITAQQILDDTRYSSLYPSATTDLLKFQNFFDMFHSDDFENVVDNFVDIWKRNGVYNIIVEPIKHRVRQFVANGNAHHNSGGVHRDLTPSYTFIAKRKLMYPNSSDYEIDYLYCWYDKGNSGNGTFEGVQIGNFYITPHTIVLMRFNSNGYSTTSYCSADEVGLSQINSGSTAFAWYMGKFKYSVINSDGTVESLDYSTLPNYQSNPAPTYFHSSNDVNSIVDNSLIDFYDDSPNAYNTIFGDVLTNVQCMFTNGFDGSFGYRGSGFSSDWYISSACVFPENGTISDYVDGHFSTSTNINVQYAPVYNGFYDFRDMSQLTTENVSNYYDYGITYNQDSQQFELDESTLNNYITNEYVSKFDTAFTGVYSNQPDVGGDFTQNTNNYIDDVDKHIEDILKKYEDENRGIKVYWDYPKYDSLGGSGSDGSTPDLPDFEITGFVPDYSNYTSQTLPAGAVSNAKAVADIGWNLFDNLGLIPVIIPLVILGLLWKLTGGD